MQGGALGGEADGFGGDGSAGGALREEGEIRLLELSVGEIVPGWCLWWYGILLLDVSSRFEKGVR